MSGFWEKNDAVESTPNLPMILSLVGSIEDYSNELVESNFRFSNRENFLEKDQSSIIEAPVSSEEYDQNFPNLSLLKTKEKVLKQETSSVHDAVNITKHKDDEVYKNTFTPLNVHFDSNSNLKRPKNSRNNKNVALTSIMGLNESKLKEHNIASSSSTLKTSVENVNKKVESQDKSHLNDVQPTSVADNNIHDDYFFTNLNSRDKVDVWLNSENGEYVKKLASVNSISTKPLKFAPNTDTAKLYKHYMDKKSETKKDNLIKENSGNTLWDHIVKKV